MTLLGNSRKFSVVFIISIFFLSMFATAIPVQAHFTLGDLTGTYRYHANDFDPHVPGVIGYVWPGGGQNAYSGFPNFANVNSGPGYQSPYPGGKPGATPGFSGNAPSSSWYQLEGDAYAPFGAVLAGSTGDLIFALNATANSCPGGVTQQGSCANNPNNRLGWSGLTIFLPPGFTMSTMDGSNVVTTVTNSYANIQVWQVSPYDRYAPGWTAVNVWVDGGQNAAKNGGNSYYNHQFLNFTSAGEWYYFRINKVTAPAIAGRYFFKMLLSGDSNYLAGPEGTARNSTASFPVGLTIDHEFPLSSILTFNLAEAPTQFIRTENWPVMLVKGEIDPAIITGTIWYAGYNQTLYSLPVQEAGRVYAKMTTRLDPYTGQARADLPKVDAVAYFNATAQGHYEVEGVAPGVYDLYASAAGYPQTLIASGITILKGQSLHFDGYLQPGVVIHGNVFTKHQFGDEPWPIKSTGGILGGSKSITDFGPNTYIKIEFYDSATLSNIPDASAGLVSWSPLPCVAGGQDLFYPKGSAVPCGDPTMGSQIAFPWHGYTPPNGYLAQQVSKSCLIGIFCVPSVSGLLTQDPQGVGPPQNWFVQGGTTTPFHFEFGVKGEYGAPRDLDGMVPQAYATWVNGLTPGRYYARAWVFRYVQTALDGSTFQEYYFDVTPNEWAGDVTLPIDLRLSSWINKTVHFHDQPNGLIEDPINTGGGFMTGFLMGADGNVYSYNQTALGLYCVSNTNPSVVCTRTGILGAPPGVFYPQRGGGGGWFVLDPRYGGFTAVPHGLYGHSVGTGANLDPYGVNSNAIQEGRANIQFWGIDKTWSGEDYGLPSGTYSPFTYVLGYVAQGAPEQVSVTLSGNPTSVSDHMIRGPGFNVTIYSVDWERPLVERPWEFGNPEGWSYQEDASLWGSDISGSSNGFQNTNSVGLGIDLGAYSNGTLVDWTGDDQAFAIASSIRSTNLFQNQFTGNVELNGGGFPIISQAGILFDANQTWFGSELFLAGSVGGVLGSFLSFPVSAQPFLAAGQFHNVKSLFLLPHFLLPTAFTPGNYQFQGFTYGYVQDRPFSVYVQNAQIADIRINLVIGVNITLDILFKKEHIITPTSANMSGRVRIFNDQGQLVGEWMSSEGTYAVSNGYSRAADGTHQYPFGPLRASVPQPLPLNGYNFIPGGTNLLHVVIAGLPQVPAATRNAPAGVPAFYNQGDPVFLPYGSAFLQAFYSGRLGLNFRTGQVGIILPETAVPGNAVGYPFPYTGIAGAPDYMGGWTAEVDFVNWYSNNTSACQPMLLSAISVAPIFQINSEQLGFCNLGTNTGPAYYPPVPGLLMGESYHIIPGTTAKSGISLTEDAALDSTFLYHSMAVNHLGPYSQQGVWQISGAHNSGEASAIQEVDLNGLVAGNALAFTWSNEFRPLSWGTLTVTGAGLPSTGLNFYTYDGVYEAYLPSTRGSAGSVFYTFNLNAPGYAPQTWKGAVSSGMSGTGNNLYLEQTNIPVPEFSTLSIVAFAALAVSLYALRRRRR